jgi:hypothetical protein
MSMEEVQAQLHKDCFGPKKHPLHFSEARRLKMISQVRYSAVWAIAWGGLRVCYLHQDCPHRSFPTATLT